MKIPKLLLVTAALGCCELHCSGATTVGVPFNVTNFVFGPFVLEAPATIRYQQVFSSSAFTGVPASDLYLSQMSLFKDWGCGIDVRRLQINISTTQRPVDGLSTNFSENVGPDDTVVFGPGECIPFRADGVPSELIFQRPFIYRPDAGNLLIDVRVFEGNPTCPFGPGSLRGQDLSTDEVSSVYALDVTATATTAAGSGGFQTVFWFYPIPSLTMYTHSTSGTDYFFIEWPTCPTVFRLQQSPVLGSGANWVTIPEATNNPSYSFQFYRFPVGSWPPSGYYRLFWNGQ